MILITLPQVDWSQRYDACHKMLPRLSAVGVQQFIDSITFSESAVDNILLENRVEIVNRALRFARQQDAALKKKGISDTQEQRFVYCLPDDRFIFYLHCEVGGENSYCYQKQLQKLKPLN